jgi:CheY-like chemotaxis protein
MPRLLLVDDNPSIHKIAETLLATSSIELVCVDSAAAALERVNRGEHFDVALVDTSMAGMDGWGLLGRLREIPSTAHMPIAMMAGVLDTVDPERIKAAPIQGFLKKPVELRDLGDRVIRLMETPVSLPEPPVPSPGAGSPFATLPATNLNDLPEFRHKQDSVAPVEDDILELTEADLYPATEVAETLPEPAEESLDLEELDLDNLRGLSVLPGESPFPLPIAASPSMADHSEPTPQQGGWPLEALDAVSTLDRLPSFEAPMAVPDTRLSDVELPDLGVPTEDLVDISSLSDLPEIGEVVTAEHEDIPLASLLAEPWEEASFTPPLPPLEESLDWSDDSESMLAVVEAPTHAEALALPKDELDLMDVTIPELAPEPNTLRLDLEGAVPVLEEEHVAPIVEAAAPPMSESTEAIVASAALESAAAPVLEPGVAPAPGPALSLGTRELLDGMMSDPVLMDALAKAVVARLGDQVLREIAWDVMPELAERLPRTGV